VAVIGTVIEAQLGVACWSSDEGVVKIVDDKAIVVGMGKCTLHFQRHPGAHVQSIDVAFKQVDENNYTYSAKW
jgi:hypothetical protein